MTTEHIWPVEPSLLFMLESLLAERNVSRAAVRAGITQSGMSRALGRLRVQLRDPLLVRSGRSMTLTPRAQAIARELREALAGVERALAGGDAFEPGNARARFHVASADYPVFILEALIGEVQRAAPNVEIIVHSLSGEFEHDLHSGALDLVIAPRRRSGASFVWSPLFKDRFVTVARQAHPRLRRKLDLDTFCELSHVVVTPEARGGNAVDRLLAERGRGRHVSLRIPSFLAALSIVSHTDLLTTTPERLASRYARAFELAVYSPPVPVPGLALWMVWHERQRHERAHAWLRELLKRSSK